MMTMWGQEHKLKLTCCESDLGLNGLLPSGLVQRVVTVENMLCARALISADRINWMKPLPLCLHRRRPRGTAVFVCYSTVEAAFPFPACQSSWMSASECGRLLVIDSGILSTPERNLRLRYLLPVSQRLLFSSTLDFVLFGPCGQL